MFEKIINKHLPKENIYKNILVSFISGGCMGVISEGLIEFFEFIFDLSFKDATICMLVFLIVISSLLTCLGKFDNLVSFCKCGLIIPITGFAHATMSSALEYRKDGLITGIGANMLKMSGAVIIYGVVSSWTFCLIREVLGII